MGAVVKPTFKKSLRETLAENRKGEELWAAINGKPLREDITPIKERRVMQPRTDHDDLEKYVITAITELLAIHPQVKFAVRQNNGSAFREVEGKQVPVKFYRWVKSDGEMLLPDFWGMMKDGRLFMIEAKKPSWKKPTDERERQQLNMLLTVRQAGGMAGFATCVEQAQKILEGK